MFIYANDNNIYTKKYQHTEDESYIMLHEWDNMNEILLSYI